MIPWVTANTKKARSNVLTTIKLKFLMIKRGYLSFYHMKSTAKLCSNQNYRISSNKRWNSNKLCTLLKKRLSLISATPQIEAVIRNLTIMELPLN